MNTLAVIIIVIFVTSDTGWCSSTGGQCYSSAQSMCEVPWTKLWIATQNRDYEQACSYFGDVHQCVGQYMTTCSFGPQEKLLYESDIIRTYTRKPYSCEIMGGNVMFWNDDKQSSGQKLQPLCSTMLVTLYIYSIFIK